jgi:hypothetical protein
LHKKGQVGVWIIIVLILIVLACFIGYIFYKNAQEKKKIQEAVINVTLEPPKHTLNILIRDTVTTNRINSSYYLINNETDERVREGFVDDNAVIQYLNATENKSYNLLAWENDNFQPDYYEKQGTCNIPNGDSTCTIYLEQEGNPVMSYMWVDSKKLKILIYNDYGIVKYPMLCFAYSTRFDSFVVQGLPKQSVPKDLQRYYDYCVYLDTIQTGEQKIVDINKEGFGDVKVLIRDFCNSYNGDDCGIEDRTISFKIK